MTQDVLKNCKKFIIQRVINPGVYWMTEFDKGKFYKRRLNEFESLLSKNVEKVNPKEVLPLGMMVAVKDDTDFHRGIIIDTFNRRSEANYLINLVDYGKTTEATKQNVYYITNKQLRHTKFGAFEITIHGIHPTILDVDYEKNTGSGIFQKRMCHTWSITAIQFVKDLVKRNPCVFVKPINTNKGKICGEIYFLEESDYEIVSLGQLLCDKGFAMFSSDKAKGKDGFQGEDKIAIEEKIPKNALITGLQESPAAETLMEVHKGKCASTEKSFKVQKGCSSLSSTETELGSGNLKSSSSTRKSDSDFYSPSWMLKKCLELYPWSSDNSLNKQGI